MAAIFERITLHKNIGVLIQTPFGSKLQVIFLFSSIVIPIITEDIHFAVRTQVESGDAMDNLTKSLFMSSSSNYVPKIEYIIHIRDEQAFKALTPSNSGIKKNERYFSILPSFLIKSVIEKDMKVTAIFLKVVNVIHDLAAEMK